MDSRGRAFGELFFPSHLWLRFFSRAMKWLGEKNGFSSDFEEIGGNNGSFRAPISDRCPEGTSKTRGKSSWDGFAENGMPFSAKPSARFFALPSDFWPLFPLSPENSMNFRGTRRLPSKIASDFRRQTRVLFLKEKRRIFPDSFGVGENIGKRANFFLFLVLFLIFPRLRRSRGKYQKKDGFFPTPILFTILSE